jgi:hypothetical protein
MLAALRHADKPVLAFKLLAASRLCDKPELVEGAFESTFRGIRPKDGVIVGMYPEFEDQAAINVEHMLRFSSLSRD